MSLTTYILIDDDGIISLKFKKWEKNLLSQLGSDLASYMHEPI